MTEAKVQLPEIPKNHVLLGQGGTFKKPNGNFIGQFYNVKYPRNNWIEATNLGGDLDYCWYIAHKDSEIAQANREGLMTPLHPSFVIVDDTLHVGGACIPLTEVQKFLVGVLHANEILIPHTEILNYTAHVVEFKRIRVGCKLYTIEDLKTLKLHVDKALEQEKEEALQVWMGDVLELHYQFWTIEAEPEQYIVARVESNQAALIDINSGNRWNDPITLPGNYDDMTKPIPLSLFGEETLKKYKVKVIRRGPAAQRAEAKMGFSS